jgi:hypothetical protein
MLSHLAGVAFLRCEAVTVAQLRMSDYDSFHLIHRHFIILPVVVLDPHLDHRTDSSEGVDHRGDERPIAQTHKSRGV